MSFYDYKTSLEISKRDYPFYALIMATFRQADNRNLAKLKSVFPEIYNEFTTRYNTPGGLLGKELEGGE
jgi:hypothetical protein